MFRSVNIVACFIAIAIVTPIVLLFWIHIVRPRHLIEHSALFDRATNVAIIEIVELHLRAFYGSYDRSLMEKLYSNDLLGRIDERFPSFRERGRLLNMIERSYMQSLSLVLENEMGESFFHVRVRVYEGLLFDPWRRIHHLSIKRDTYGSHTIIYIEFDR